MGVIPPGSRRPIWPFFDRHSAIADVFRTFRYFFDFALWVTVFGMVFVYDVTSSRNLACLH